MIHRWLIRFCGSFALTVLAVIYASSPALAGGDANFFLGTNAVAGRDSEQRDEPDNRGK